MKPIQPPPPFPPLWPTSSPHFLKPSAHFRAHHPAFRNFRTQTVANPSNMEPNFNGFVELDVNVVREDLRNNANEHSNEGLVESQVTVEESDEEVWSEELVMDEEWAQHFAIRQHQKMKTQNETLNEIELLPSTDDYGAPVSKSKKHKKSKKKKSKGGVYGMRKPIPSIPVVTPWRNVRYRNDRLSEVRTLESEVKELAIKHGRSWPEYPEVEIFAARS